MQNTMMPKIGDALQRCLSRIRRLLQLAGKSVSAEPFGNTRLEYSQPGPISAPCQNHGLSKCGTSENPVIRCAYLHLSYNRQPSNRPRMEAVARFPLGV